MEKKKKNFSHSPKDQVGTEHFAFQNMDEISQPKNLKTLTKNFETKKKKENFGWSRVFWCCVICQEKYSLNCVL